MGDIKKWLSALGLEQYAEIFRGNDIDTSTLALLCNEDLREMGIVSVGHRRRLLNAIEKISTNSARPIPTQDQEFDLTGERRQVTILFADLVGFTKLSDTQDAEQTHALLNRYFEYVDGIVNDFGGVIDKHIGDSVMACFGAPIAHGNDSERAALAALEIHKSMELLSAETKSRMQAHIGVASGQVVASNTGSDAHREYTVTGASVNLASRLQELAGPAETIVSDAVYHAIHDAMECEPLGAIDVRGLEKPVQAWRMNGRKPESGRSRRALVGRQSELRQFSGILDECLETGLGRSLHIRGSAGIGKTRLVEEFVTLARHRRIACHKGLILDFGVGRGQDAIRTLVRSLLRVRETATLEERFAIADLVIENAGLEPKLRVFLNDFLNIPQPADLRAVYDAMDNDTRNKGKEAVVAGLIRYASQSACTFLVIEDVHWADRITLAHIANIASVAGTCPTILVVTSRAEGDPLDASWRAKVKGGALVTIDIGPLRESDAREIAKSFLGDGKFVDDCISRADGNPLFLEQLLENAKVDKDGKIPDTIQSLVLARMDRLPKADKVALQTASIIGQRFDIQCLRAMIDDPDYDCAQLIEDLLVRPEGEYFLFSHALVQEGVYSSLLQSKRTGMHRKAADWFADRDHIVYAQHLDRAGDISAPGAYGKAARIEASEYRLDRAVTLVERALELARTEVDRFELSCLRGELLHDLGFPEESVEAYRTALDCAKTASERCQAWIGIAAGLRLTDKYEEALSVLESAEDVAIANRLEADLARLHHLRGNLYFPTGKIEACLREHQAALEYASASRTPVNEARALSGMGDAEYARGRLISANAYYERCLKICRQEGQGRIEAANLAQVAHIQHYFKPLPYALNASFAAIEAASKIGHDRAEIVAHLTAVDDLLDLGEFGRIIAHLDRVKTLEEKLGARRFRGRRLTYEAQVFRAKGNQDRASDLLQEAIDSCRESGMNYFGPVALGELALTTTNSQTRQSALEEGQQILKSGSMSRNHFWFHRAAMEASWLEGAWEVIEHYADALANYTMAEPLSWTQIIIERGRALAAFGRNGHTDANIASLREVRDKAVHMGLRSALGTVEQALSAS